MTPIAVIEGVELVVLRAWPKRIPVRLAAVPGPLTDAMDADYAHAIAHWERRHQQEPPQMPMSVLVSGFPVSLHDAAGTSYEMSTRRIRGHRRGMGRGVDVPPGAPARRD